MSNVRLTTKSRPSKTGGLSSNRGSDWPGTNSIRSIRISIVEGATRTLTPCSWQRSTSSTASSCGNSGSAIRTSSTALKLRSSVSSVPKSVSRLERCGVSDTYPNGWIAWLPESASATASIWAPPPTSTARRR